MPRDYARSRRQSEERSGPSGFVWMLSGILIGFIIAGVFYIKNQTKPKPITLPTATQQAQPSQQNQQTATQSQPKKPQTQNLQTQFDFYNVLPSQKVIGPSGDEDTTQIQNQNSNLQNPAPQQSSATPAPTTSAPATPAAPQPQAQAVAPVVQATPTPTPVAPAKPSGYILQIATFSQYSDADQLKAQLSLLGYDVKVSTVQKGGKSLQRVWLGPFSSRDEAQSTQKQLQENLISSKILKSN